MSEIKWGPIGETVYNRTYSRVKADGTNETWPETVERTVTGNINLVDKKFIEKNEKEKLIALLKDFKALPAGRHLWVSGVPGKQFLFNCHTSGWGEDISSHYIFTFDELMKGGGVGANYSNRYISKYPKVKNKVNMFFVSDKTHKDYDKFKHLITDKYSQEWNGCFRIPDTREGWVESLGVLLDKHLHSNGEDLVFDVSLIRPFGAPIRGFGGTSSGPISLMEMLKDINTLLNEKQDKKLTSHDLMLLDHFIAACVISGNVRRSARMAIKSWKDEDIFEFINCKKDNPLYHWSTNISIEIDDQFLTAIKKKDKHAIKIYNECVRGMVTNGEPGFWNKSLSDIGEVEKTYSTNPCGEIALSEWENCNLGHINLDPFYNDDAGAKEAFRLMTRFLIRATYGNITDEKQRKIVDKNRRIGVGLFGFQGWLCKQGLRYSDCHSNEMVKIKLNAFKNLVREEARKYAFQLRIPEPVKVTTIAPTGTIAKLPGVSEGAQCIYSRYFIRRVRFSETDKELKKYQSKKYNIEDCMYSKNTKVVSFYCKDKLVEEIVSMGLDENLVEQQDEIAFTDSLAVQAMLQREYTDNAISFTISLLPSEDNYDMVRTSLIHYLPQVKGTTIMIDGSRPQSPYERITKEQFEEAEYGEVSQGDMDCSTGACPIR